MSQRGGMTRVAVTQAAVDAIVETMPAVGGVENERTANGDFYLWLPNWALDMLNGMRDRGESLSDVIVRCC
jgi:hypothetical protein